MKGSGKRKGEGVRAEPMQRPLEHQGIGVPVTDPGAVVIILNNAPKPLTSGKLFSPSSRNAYLAGVIMVETHFQPIAVS